MMLRLIGVWKHYGRRAILADVDLSLGTHQTVALLGANGAGKTTLLRLAATLTHPDRGQVLVGNQETRREGAKARTQLAYVSDRAPLYDELTPLEHVRWQAGLHAQPLSEAAALDLLASAGLARLAHRQCRTLSRGQRQRTALASAFATRARFLLLDEPFTALDTEGAAWLEAELAKHKATGGTTLMALHGDAHARTLCDRIFCIQARSVVEETPEEPQ